MPSKSKIRVLDRINIGLRAIGLCRKGKLEDILKCERAITAVVNEVKDRSHFTQSAVIYDLANAILLRNPLSFSDEKNKVVLALHVLVFGQIARELEDARFADREYYIRLGAALSACGNIATNEISLVRRICKYAYKTNRHIIECGEFDSRYLMATYQEIQKHMPLWLSRLCSFCNPSN